MKSTKVVVAGLAIFASAGANAVVTGSLGGSTSNFLSLSPVSSCAAGCTLGGVNTIMGGTIYSNDLPFADVPKGGVFENRFLAAGPSSGSPSTITFAGSGVSYLSFLWGSPDTYNTLTINGTTTFTAMSLGFPVTNGDQSFSQYVQFFASAGDFIKTASFSSATIDAFEVANFSTTVPEPGTLALFGAGLVGMWMAVRRRKVSIDSGLSAA